MNSLKLKNVLSTYLPSLLIGLIGFLAVGYFTFFRFDQEAPIMVLFPPWTSEEQAVLKALTPPSKLVRSDFGGKIVMVMPEHENYVSQVRKLGAWGVISSFGIGGCNPRPSNIYGRNL